MDNKIENILFGKEARQKLEDGADVVANAVKCTLGPKGRNVVLTKGSIFSPHITKDGVSIAKEIFLEDPFMNMGAQMMKQAALKQVEVAGDGTTTTTVLAQHLLSEGIKAVNEGGNPVLIKRGMEEALEVVKESLKTQSREVSGYDDIKAVATISANGDIEIGENVAKAIIEVGEDGAVTAEVFPISKTQVEIVKGMQFEKGIVSPYFSTNMVKGTAELEDPYILLTDKHIQDVSPLMPLLNKVLKECQANGRSLLIICGEMSGEVLNTLVKNKMQGTLRCAVVQAPGFGSIRRDFLEDIAVTTGATVIGDDAGTSFKNVTIDDLGRSQKIVSSYDKTIIIEGQGDTEKVDTRIKLIKDQIKESTAELDIDILSRRLAKLSGAVALIQVGGKTDMEAKEAKDRYDDALCATRCAQEEGIVKGGGVALVNVSTNIPHYSIPKGDLEIGYQLVVNSLEAPFNQIISNAGISYGKLRPCLQDNRGVDALTGKVVGNMFKEGIVDPTKVVRSALEDAISVAGMMITTESVVDRTENLKKADELKEAFGLDL